MDKIYKPGECMKYMKVEMHPELLSEWFCADVVREVEASGAKVVPTPDMCDPGLVLWSRSIPQTLSKTNGEVHLSSSKEVSECALYVSTAEEVAGKVSAGELMQHVTSIQELVGRSLSLVVFGVKDYFKSSGRKTQNSNKLLMTPIQFEMAKTDMLVSTDCDVVVVNSSNELALLILQFTKAVAEAPHKRRIRERDEQAEFYMKGDNKNCIAIAKNGMGVGQAWQQMVSVLPKSSLETARALCALYPTPRALYEELQKPDSVNALADVGVSRAAVPGARARRTGPELARRLHALLTTEDGSVILD